MEGLFIKYFIAITCMTLFVVCAKYVLCKLSRGNKNKYEVNRFTKHNR